MSKNILLNVKKCIRLNLDEKAYEILKEQNTLSKKDIEEIIKYMYSKNNYSSGVFRYIYFESEYRHYFIDYSYKFSPKSIFLQKIINNACEKGDLDLLKQMISLRDDFYVFGNLDPNPLPNYKYYSTAISKAVVSANSDIVKFLLDYSVSIHRRGSGRLFYSNYLKSSYYLTAILTAIDSGSIKIFKMLLSYSYDNPQLFYDLDKWLDILHNVSMERACIRGNFDIVKYLLENQKVKLDESNKFILCSSKPDSIEVLKLLLSYGSMFSVMDPSYNQNEAINCAKFKGYRDVCEILAQDERVIQKSIDESIKQYLYDLVDTI